jgi:hypothetical protein
VVKRSEFERYRESNTPVDMVDIVTKDQAISKEIADAACRSLDEDVDRKRREGKLDAGKSSSVGLEWTIETRAALRAYEAAFLANVRT